MQFAIRQTVNGTWLLTPKSGRFAGVDVAEVEGLSMHHAVSVGKTIVGPLRATWGMTVLDDRVYEDRETVRGLAINGVFTPASRDQVWLDFDGLRNWQNHATGKVMSLIAFGHRLYAKGLK